MAPDPFFPELLECLEGKIILEDKELRIQKKN
jgi:hypothetical protein